jgi:cytochrome P450
VYRLPIDRLKRVDLAFNELDAHLLALVRERRAALASGTAEGKADLFGSLLLAGKDEDGDEGIDGEKTEAGGIASIGAGKADGGSPSEGLTDREVLGNTFIFLLAGHETSGHTLAFVFALLALHPEEQQKLHDHVVSVLPAGQEPVRPFCLSRRLLLAAFR